ncbi:hypothetical protein WKI68_42640 [Streptomyces sp. MS1.HAVA.3]|uniref:Uncharacterized protein n=1 Tax=Streptomyces caledonius TaxID=3134107 RepID=A0ABU8UE09_9ACTN
MDWDTIGDRPVYEVDVDLAGPLADWTAHLSVVRAAAVPLPERPAALLVEMAGQLAATAANVPLAALSAAGVLERIAARVGREAAGALCDDGMPAEAVATALSGSRSTTARPGRPPSRWMCCAWASTSFGRLESLGFGAHGREIRAAGGFTKAQAPVSPVSTHLPTCDLSVSGQWCERQLVVVCCRWSVVASGCGSTVLEVRDRLGIAVSGLYLPDG